MDPGQRTNAKRCIQILLPTAPAPMVDYALNATVFATIHKSSSQSNAESDDRNTFALRRMNSGNFGEISITSPVSKKHLKNNFFGEADKLAFTFVDLRTDGRSKRK